jgi:hypothetical protein
VPFNKGGERGLGRFAIPQHESLNQLAIRDPGERAKVEESLQAARENSIQVRWHERGPPW